MAYTLGSKCAKNICKRTVLLQLIIENVVTCFFGTQCSYTQETYQRHERYIMSRIIRLNKWATENTGVENAALA